MVRDRSFKELLSVSDALESLLLKLKTLDVEKISVYNCVGRVLAEDVYAPTDVPPFDRAAMDGYAVRAEDTFGASLTNPIILEVVGKVEIGQNPDITIAKGKTAKIATGAMIPKGANAVVMVEYTRRNGDFVEILKPVTPFKNVSRKGEDVKAGELVLKRGEIIQPQDAGVLASLGFNEIKVYRKPRVAIISTGNELVEVGKELEHGKIYNSNNPMLVNALKEFGIEATSFGVVKDVEDEIESKLLEAMDYDVVIFTGGTSVGEKDLVPKVVEKYAEIIFHGVAMKPGMPTGAAVANGKPIFMLPGSPAAAMLAFYAFVVPSVYRMMNVRLIAKKWTKVKGILSKRVSSDIGIRSFVRAYWDGERVYPVRVSGSMILTTLVRANAILMVPENLEGYEEGEDVEVILLRDVTEVFE